MMKYVLIAYFLVSGVVFCAKGLRQFGAGAHFGPPISWFEMETLKASVSGDAQKEQRLKEAFEKFEKHADEISSQSFDGAVLLGLAGILHFVVGGWWLAAICLRRLAGATSEGEEPIQASETTRGK
jgi:hypothetical protein